MKLPIFRLISFGLFHCMTQQTNGDVQSLEKIDARNETELKDFLLGCAKNEGISKSLDDSQRRVNTFRDEQTQLENTCFNIKFYAALPNFT